MLEKANVMEEKREMNREWNKKMERYKKRRKTSTEDHYINDIGFKKIVKGASEQRNYS